MKKHATTIVLAALCALFAIWLVADRDKVTDTERKRRESSVFPAWRRDELTRIEISRQLEKLVLVRDAQKDSTWSMKSPREERTDFGAIERLMTTLELATVARRVTDGGLGFESPRAHGSIEMGGLVMRFALGAPSPRPEGSSYFRLDDGPPFVVSKELTDALLAGADVYRTKSVVPYLSTEIQKLEAKTEGGESFVLTRADDRLFTAAGALASREEVDKIWNALAEMRAEAFPKDADADRLTASPALTVVMTPKDGRPPGELRIGGECPGEPNDVVVLRTSPTRLAACIPKGAPAALARAESSFVMTRPFSFRADEIEELRLERVGGDDAGPAPGAIEIARKGSGFHQREPIDRDLSAAEADAASALIEAIERATSAKPVARSDKPFEAAFRVRVHAGDRDETVELGPIDAEKAQLHRLKDDMVLELPRVTALAFVPRETSFTSRTLLGDTRPVKKVVARCGTPQELTDQGTGLRLVEPPGYETDASITQLVDAITRGRIDRWVADEGAFGIEPDGCRIVLAFDDGNAPVTVRFGKEDGGNVFGKLDGSPHVFVTGASFLTLARSIFVSRGSLRVEASRIEDVRVTTDAPLAKNPAVIRDTVAGFIAESVASLGEPNVGAVDLTIEVALAEGGPPKRILCGPADKNARRKCATPDIRAVFTVARGQWIRFFDSADGGVARDAGSR